MCATRKCPYDVTLTTWGNRILSFRRHWVSQEHSRLRYQLTNQLSYGLGVGVDVAAQGEMGMGDTQEWIRKSVG